MTKKWATVVMVVASVVTGTLASAQDEGSTRRVTAKKWQEAWLQRPVNDEAKRSFVERLVFAKKAPGKTCPEFFELKPEVFAQHGYFRISDPMDLDFAYKLNLRNLACNRKTHERADAVKELFVLSNADTLVTVGKKDWSLIQLVDGEPQRLLSVPGPASESEEGLAKWLAQAVGFDAVVLEKRGAYVLAKANAELLQGKIQALAIDDSEDKIALPPANRKGKALLQLVDASGEYGVFKILTFGKNKSEIAYGTKLLVPK